MRQIRPILLLLLAAISFSACTYEEPIIQEDNPELRIEFDMQTGPNITLLEGWLTNTGNIYIDDAQLQVKFFNDKGHLLDVEWFDFDTNLNPDEEMRFHIEYPIPYAYEATVVVYEIW